jgi:hypothetical protein
MFIAEGLTAKATGVRTASARPEVWYHLLSCLELSAAQIARRTKYAQAHLSAAYKNVKESIPSRTDPASFGAPDSDDIKLTTSS